MKKPTPKQDAKVNRTLAQGPISHDFVDQTELTRVLKKADPQIYSAMAAAVTATTAQNLTPVATSIPGNNLAAIVDAS